MASADHITESRPEAITSQRVTRPAIRLLTISWETIVDCEPAQQSAIDVELTRFDWRRHRTFESQQSEQESTTERRYGGTGGLHVTDSHVITGHFHVEVEPHFFEWNSDVTDDFYSRLSQKNRMVRRTPCRPLVCRAERMTDV